MIREHLELPPRAARLWPTLVNVTQRFFPHIRGQPGWTLGGGTVLAARWNRHRGSTDLDAKIQEVFTDEARTDLASMFEQGDRWFAPGRKLDRMMYRAGGRKIQATAEQRVYEFEEARIDLFQPGTIRIWAARQAVIENTPAWTEPTAAILHGKLDGRGRRPPVRDLFDIAVALKLDPDALREALSRTRPTTMQMMREIWHERRKVMKEAGRRDLEDVAPQWQAIAHDPAAAALDAVHSLTKSRWKSPTSRAIKRANEEAKNTRHYETNRHTTDGHER